MADTTQPPPMTFPFRPSSLADEARALLSSPDRLAALGIASPEARRGACVVLAGIVRGSLATTSPERGASPTPAEPRFPEGNGPVVAGE